MKLDIPILPPNPFMPGFGRYPKLLLDQQQNLVDYLTRLFNDDVKAQTSLVYGARGTGKTVFLLSVQQALTEYPDWHFIRLNANQGDLLFQLLHALQIETRTPLNDIFKNIMGTGITLRSTSTGQQIDYHYYLVQLLERLQQRHQHVLIAIDEVNPNDDLRYFSAEYQTLIGSDYPLALLMTGLPSQVTSLQNDKTLTFLLRSHRIHLKPLDKISISENFRRVFEGGKRQFEFSEIQRLTQAVGGYAYAFQLVGYYTWQLTETTPQITPAIVDKVITNLKHDLYQNAYLRMYQDLTPTARKIVRLIARSAETMVSSNWIGEKLNKPKNYVSVYRAQLLENQIVIAPKWGYLAFNLPYFKDFIQSLDA